MSHILITNRLGKTTRFHLGPWQWLIIASLIAAIMGGGYYLGTQQATNTASPDFMVSALQKELDKYSKAIEEVRLSTQDNMNALASRVGELKARVIRLDALGERLIEKAKLDKGEFDFDNSPAQGGPEVTGSSRTEAYAAPDLMKSLDELSARIERSSMQLTILESMLMNRDLHDEVYPAGRPIKKGWISSYFGYRTDPFTGRRARHEGIDLAGKKGSDVIAVASGVVTWAGKRYGYGNLVEINHGNGYVTRYGHNQSILVKVGDKVEKGQTIAKMGSTGRSTGPHVHFEVIRNGRKVDPMKYVRASR